MLMHPKKGRRVQLWYADRSMPHHGKLGTVAEPAAKGNGPRNHLIRLDDGNEVVVPSGNLKKEPRRG